MLLSWQYPDDNSETITSYSIQIRGSDGVTYAESDECDGQDSVIVETRQCTIAIKSLRETPFNLQFDDFIVIRVNSLNALG